MKCVLNAFVITKNGKRMRRELQSIILISIMGEEQ